MEGLLTGLNILHKYVGDKGSVSAEHEQIYAGGDGQEEMTKEDQKAMETAGWFFDKEMDSWLYFP